MKEVAKLLMMTGAIFLVVGGAIFFLGNVSGLGKLPGDISVRRGNFSFHFPLASCLLISLLLTLIFNFIGRK